MICVSPRLRLLCLYAFQAFLLVRGQPKPSRMKQMLTSHFSLPRHHVTNPEYKMAAKKFIEGEFRRMKLTTVEHTFDTAQNNVKGKTVVGILKGANYNTSNDSIVAISAHYDTMRSTPGVNDNGAGVVVMLEAARELAKHQPRASTVLFIAFDFEEWESGDDAACDHRTGRLCGSRALIKDWLPTYFQHWPLTWKGLVNMDTILNFDDQKNSQNIPRGFDRLFPKKLASIQADQMEGDFLTVVGRTEDLDIVKDVNSSWVSQGHPDFESEVFSLSANILPYAGDFLRSDHASFWVANLTAVFLTDTANYRGYMKQCYHSQCDNITHATEERLQFAAKISGALISWVDLTAPPVDTDPTSAAERLSLCPLSSLLAVLVVTVTSQWSLRQRRG